MRTLLIALLMSLLVGPLMTRQSDADVIANFDGGNGTAVPDAYKGIGGAGWAGPWEELRDDLAAAPYTNIVVRTAGDSGYDDPYQELASGTGNYLYVDANLNKAQKGFATVARNYSGSGGIDLALSHTIDFLFRVDESATALANNFTTSDDRYQIYDYPTIRGGTTSDCTWMIGGYGSNLDTNGDPVSWLNANDAGYFLVYNGLGHLGNDGLYSSRWQNTGIAIQEGVTCDVHLAINPAGKSWDISITDGTTTFNSQNLGWRRNTLGDPTVTVAGNMQFCAAGNLGNDERQFSLDSVTVSGTEISNELPTADGFRGIWYSIGTAGNYKYSGGLGTYPQQIAPHAIYSETAKKTFFVYGGTDETNSTLQHMVSYYDHETGQVARPRILMDKGTIDAHDNPCIVMDNEGYVYIFSSAHGTTRSSYISRSAQPYSVDAFDTVLSLPAGDNNFSYAQPLYIEGQGFMLLHTHYTDDGRTLFYNTSSDGVTWDYDWDSRPEIARIPGGQYQVSEAIGQKVGTAFNYHPGKVVDQRTNLYYMQTTDMGTTWTTVDGTSLTTPVTTVSNAALVYDYQSEGLLVYVKDIQYDAEGDPILFYQTSSDAMPGSVGEPRTFHTAHWDGDDWIIRDAFTTDHNYDFGPLYVEEDGTWRVIAPTDPGPEPLSTGGEMEMWISEDEGGTWELIRQLTHGSDNNHTYARQPRDAQEGFYAFWADGDALVPSDSQLYFTDALGTGVWKLPEFMDGDFATPEFVDSSIGAPIAGDANDDGIVDAQDAKILAQNWTKSSWASWSDGDFNHDGRVDAADVSIMAANWGSVAGTEQAAVPEPCLASLLVTACVFGTLCHGRTRRRKKNKKHDGSEEPSFLDI